MVVMAGKTGLVVAVGGNGYGRGIRVWSKWDVLGVLERGCLRSEERVARWAIESRWKSSTYIVTVAGNAVVAAIEPSWVLGVACLGR